jgi:hypothetical protein
MVSVDGKDQKDYKSSEKKPRAASQNEIAEKHDNVKTTAQYIADLTGELAILAKSAKLTLLTYLLAVARHEAEVHSSRAS